MKFCLNVLLLIAYTFLVSSCSQEELFTNLTVSQSDERTAQIDEINSIYRKYGKDNCAVLNFSSFKLDEGKQGVDSKSGIPDNIISDIYSSVLNFRAGVKSSTSENLIVRERNELYSGSYQDYKEKSVYRFYSLDADMMVIIDESDKLVGNEGTLSCSMNSESIADCEEGDNSECLGECVGHIDILFLWSDQAKEQFVSELDRVAHLDLMMDQLRLANANSNIQNTYNYHYSDYNYDRTFQPRCEQDINIFLDNRPTLYDMRSAFGADIVVFLSNPEEYWDNAEACVPDFGVIPDKAFTVIPIDKTLHEFIFPHEIGHLFGARHGNSAGSTTSRYCCGQGNDIVFPGDNHAVRFSSIMHLGNRRIPYYTDPDIYYEYNGESKPIGFFHQTTGSMFNNAGLMRNYGCEVAGIETSLDLNVSLYKNYDNCMLNVYSAADNSQLSAEKFKWYFSSSRYIYDPMNFLGGGYNLSVEDPVPDPCVRYYIHLVVENEGYVIHKSSIETAGGICIDNVWCNDGSGDN